MNPRRCGASSSGRSCFPAAAFGGGGGAVGLQPAMRRTSAKTRLPAAAESAHCRKSSLSAMLSLCSVFSCLGSGKIVQTHFQITP